MSVRTFLLLLVLAVCAAPVIASYLTYYVIRPETHKSFGTLIEPQRPLPALAATDLAGRPAAARHDGVCLMLIGHAATLYALVHLARGRPPAAFIPSHSHVR